MDYKYIEQLLERYWNCETTLEEENILRSFFSQKDVPVGLLRYKDLFAYEQAEKKEDTLGDDFDKRMLSLIEEEVPVKARIVTMNQRLMPLFKAAAVVAIFLTLGNAAHWTFNGEDRYNSASTTPATYKGASVAISDTLKTDTLKKATETAIVIK